MIITLIVEIVYCIFVKMFIKSIKVYLLYYIILLGRSDKQERRNDKFMMMRWWGDNKQVLNYSTRQIHIILISYF